MSRAIRKETVAFIEREHAREPLSLGLYLGVLAVRLNVTPALMAKVIGTHEQTVVRWILSRSRVHPRWANKVAKMVCLLAWMHDTFHPALTGDLASREHQLLTAGRKFNALARSSVKTKAVA